jgi:hypothetical protein
MRPALHKGTVNKAAKDRYDSSGPSSHMWLSSFSRASPDNCWGSNINYAVMACLSIFSIFTRVFHFLIMTCLSNEAPPFISSALDGVELSASRLGPLSPGQYPATYWIGCMSPRAGLHAVE